jgi:cell division septation protein DedD
MSEQPEEGADAGGERLVRDMERWKDRVEVSLDNRQVFFLFFGSAVVACLIFVLGIMVGKRLEARARDQVVPMKSDPLAALEQAAEEADETSPAPRAPAALPPAAPSQSPAPPRREPPKLATPVPVKIEAPPAVKVEVPPPVRPAPPPPPAKIAPVPVKVAPAPVPAKVETPVAAERTEKPEKPEKPTPHAAAAASPNPASLGPAQAVPAEKLAAASKAGGSRYTLQLSAFQDRAEAEDFAKKLGGSGYKPNVVAADIPGRGVWYRVRVGDFSSQKAALDAKADLERKLHVIAYVTKL